jgi:hypothetical protein
MKGKMAFFIAGSIMLSGCTTTEGKTISGGAVFGALAGGLIGKVAGGNDGAVAGAGIGALVGAGVGSYVAEKKKKYASVEARIAGERELVAQSIATSEAQIASSDAQLRLLDTQLAALNRKRVAKASAWQQATAMLSRLEGERAALERNRASLQTQITNQKQFVQSTEREVGRKNAARAAQVAQWREDIPRMEVVLERMTVQIANVDASKSRVLQVRQSFS